ncbi:MAG TPA: glycosyltransferase family 9 protein [Bryobacteraceae bacterium]|nr:glycosyltransferase family 9 protein [Bryobacteraceae bacterium]
MGSILESLPQASRVAVVRLRSLGDCVLTTPALHILKRARPDLRVAVVVEERFRGVFEGNPDLAEILPPEAGTLRRWGPRLCLNLHGGPRSAWLTAASGAGLRAGFAHFRNGFVYNVRIPRAQEILGTGRKVHTAEHLASAVFYLGAEICEIPRARLAARAAHRSSTVTAPIAVIHPFATAAGKTWAAENFVAVAEHLAAHGMEPVLIGGTGDNFAPFARFRALRGAPLDEVKTLLASAALFVGNDSGPAHMAAAFGLPVAVIFSASDPAIWGPWRTASEVIRTPAAVGQVIEALARLQVAA